MGPNVIDPSRDNPQDTWTRLASRRLLTHAVAHNGAARTALLYVPQHVRRRGGLPLVLMVHGGASTPETIARRSGMHQLAEREGFIVAYPRGTAGKHGATWNPAGNKAARKTNDTRFLRALIDDLERHYEIDPYRIYAAGFSIGGSLVYELACLMADRIAAIAVVSGTMTTSHCDPARPVPLIHIHGTADRRVPLEGGRGPATQRVGEWSPVQVGIDRWREINGCIGAAEVVRHSPGVTCHRHAGAADVELWLVEGGAHVWPGAEASGVKPSGAKLSVVKASAVARPEPTDAFSATETIWRFFAAHPRRRRMIAAADPRDATETPTTLTSDGAR